MLPTVKVVFDRKKLATNSKGGLIQIEVYYNRQRKWISTGIKVYKDQWKPIVGVCNRRDAVDLNDRIAAICSDINAYITDCIKKGKEFVLDEAVQRVQSINRSDNTSFIDFIQKRINETNMSDSTRVRHQAIVGILIDFGKILSFSDVTLENIHLFDDWVKKKVNKQTTVYDYHKRLKVYVRQAYAFGKISNYPYFNFKVSKGESIDSIRYLTQQELTIIRNCEIPQNLESTRDLFLFQCMTSLSYTDLAKFDYDNDVVEENGKFKFEDKRQKTNERYFIVLLPMAVEILRKYGNKLPMLNNQTYNRRLKLLAAYCKIKKPIATHYARHTGAILALNNGVPIETVSKMLGHSSIKTTQIYAQMLNNQVEQAYEKMEGVWGEI